MSGAFPCKLAGELLLLCCVADTVSRGMAYAPVLLMCWQPCEVLGLGTLGFSEPQIVAKDEVALRSACVCCYTSHRVCCALREACRRMNISFIWHVSQVLA